MAWIWAAMCTSKARIDGKTAILTGANIGIGKETALDLVKRGGNIIIASRNLKRNESAIKEIEKTIKDIPNCGKLTSVHLDLNSLASVRVCAKQLLAENPKIHILINNAGIFSTPYKVTEDGFEAHFGVNHLGPFLLTCLLLPRIKSSAPARIINVSSRAHQWGSIKFEDLKMEKSYSGFKAYNRSKLANILFTKELAERLKGTCATVYALHPGTVATDLLSKFLGHFIPITIVDALVPYFFKTTIQGAQTTIYCAVDKKLEKESGLYYSNCHVSQPSKAAQDMETAKKLWIISCELVKLDFDPISTPDKS